MYLNEHGIDNSLIDDALNKRCALKQIIQLNEVVKLMNRSMNQSFLDQTNEYISKLINETISNTLNAPPYETFQFTLHKKINLLREFNG